MNQAPVKLGPLALLLTVISICLTILSILTYTTAGADDRLAQRYAPTTTERYELEIMGQEALAEFPSGFEQGENGLEKTITSGDLTLTIDAVEEDGTVRVTSWRMNREWELDTQMHNLWDGY